VGAPPAAGLTNGFTDFLDFWEETEMRILTRTAFVALITLLFSAAAFAQYSQPVRVVNTSDQAVPVKDVPASIATSARAVILAGQSGTTAEAAVPACPGSTKFLVNGLRVAPEIILGVTGNDVTQLPHWGVSLWLWQKTSWGGFAVPLNLLGNGPQHLSVTLPAGQHPESTTLTTYIVLLGGVTASRRFEFNVHITGYCGTQFIKP
jgi:hypothetical protein